MMKLCLYKPLLLLFSLTFLTACYPIYKTLQPEINVTVQDEHGKSLDQVPVMLIREPNVGMGYRYSLLNTEQGQVHFKRLAEWRVEFLMMHGAVNYRWYLCVAEPGYETQSEIVVDQKDIKIVLKKPNQKAKKINPDVPDISISNCDQRPFFEITPANEKE